MIRSDPTAIMTMVGDDDDYLWFPCLVGPKVVVNFVKAVIAKTATFEKIIFGLRPLFSFKKHTLTCVLGTHIPKYYRSRDFENHIPPGKYRCNTVA